MAITVFLGIFAHNKLRGSSLKNFFFYYFSVEDVTRLCLCKPSHYLLNHGDFNLKFYLTKHTENVSDCFNSFLISMISKEEEMFQI